MDILANPAVQPAFDILIDYGVAALIGALAPVLRWAFGSDEYGEKLKARRHAIQNAIRRLRGRPILAVLLAAGLAGCAQVDAARRGAESIAAAGPVLGPAIGRVVATCTGPAPELEAAKAALADAFEVEALSDPAIRAHAMVTALCGAGRAGPAG